MVKKRTPYMRFSGEPLPEPPLGPGEYHADGQTFLRLAEANVALRHGAADEDTKLLAVLSLLEGTSFDIRLARKARGDLAERQRAAQALERIRDVVLDLSLIHI